jgi:hypothetical protein
MIQRREAISSTIKAAENKYSSHLKGSSLATTSISTVSNAHQTSKLERDTRVL